MVPWPPLVSQLDVGLIFQPGNPVSSANGRAHAIHISTGKGRKNQLENVSFIESGRKGGEERKAGLKTVI